MTAPPDLRWRLADDDSQGALFEEELGRRPGEGEFRGTEFIHVRARRIINEVPKASMVPFRYTINAYRGCSHACSYCLEGSTPILMGDGSTKAIADLVVGDEVYGTVRQGAYRRFVRTPVLDHWTTYKEAYKVTLEDGTTLIASADHRFLSDRGWKHVIGAEGGPLQRPHLTPNNRLLGLGRFAAGPKHDAEYQLGYLAGMIGGDGRPHYDDPRPGRQSGLVHRFRLPLVDLEPLARVGQYLSDREAAMDRPAECTDEWRRGFLAGTFDAEGSYGGSLRIANGDPGIIGKITECLSALDYRFVIETLENRVQCVRLLGGLAEVLRFFHSVDPVITRKRSIEGRALKTTAALRVRQVQPLRMELPLYDITTGTGDFLADGVVSHNCFARPTHEFLGMNIGEDFERRIVVKVNAVERLRAELAPAKWGGHHIAMGTNTDPYQRCEGKYRLTRGIIRELSAARNPFSILTKSTLILRDLDLLAEAATRTDVAANFSIGTLDDDVWRSTEPGTPHPMRRVEAVARLNLAGVPCGVLLAPVLPGLSDRPDQLEAVVKACAGAGARSISPLLLHLRPGVKEHYLGWLAEAHPELIAEHARLYPRAYAPKRRQQQLSALVGELAARHGMPARHPREARSVRRPPRAPEAAVSSRQLGLGI